MALLNGQDQPKKEGTTGTAVMSSDAKAKKLESLKRFKERRAERAKKAFDDALKLRDELVKGSFMDKLSQTAKDFVLSLCKDPAERKASGGFGGPSVFSILFGDNAKVGDSITLEQAFNKTYKGKSTLDVWVKRWADKGIIVDCVIDSAKMLNTKYTIKAMPAA